MDKIKSLLLFSLLFLFMEASAKDIYVVCVGVSNYENIPSLRLPQEDAKSIAELYKVHTRNVSILTGRYATKAAILKECRNMFSKAKSGDMVVFSFSGHGLKGGLCPYDMGKDGSNGILYEDIQRIMRASSADQKIIIADACFSGGLRMSESGNGSSHDDSNVILFLSSRDGETSQESLFMKNGIFTTYLLQGLRGGADSNRDRRISAKELFTFVSRNVREKTDDSQHPVMWGNFNDNFIFMQW